MNCSQGKSSCYKLPPVRHGETGEDSSMQVWQPRIGTVPVELRRWYQVYVNLYNISTMATTRWLLDGYNPYNDRRNTIDINGRPEIDIDG